MYIFIILTVIPFHEIGMYCNYNCITNSLQIALQIALQIPLQISL